MNLPSVFIRKRTRWSSYPWGSPGGKNQWHWHFFIVVSLMLGLWRRSTAAVNCLWPRAALEMGSCLWTVCLHWAPIEQGHSRLNQSRVVMLFLPSAAKKSKCDVCDEITDVFHKISQFPPTVVDNDMKIFVRFVCECMTDPAQLRASMMQDWRCFQGNRDQLAARHYCSRPMWSELSSSGQHKESVNSIPARLQTGDTFHYWGEMPSAD